jgi:hypothetical protein
VSEWMSLCWHVIKRMVTMYVRVLGGESSNTSVHASKRDAIHVKKCCRSNGSQYIFTGYMSHMDFPYVRWDASYKTLPKQS